MSQDPICILLDTYKTKVFIKIECVFLRAAREERRKGGDKWGCTRRNGKNDTDKCIMTAILYNTIEEKGQQSTLLGFPRVQNPIQYFVSKGCFYLSCFWLTSGLLLLFDTWEMKSMPRRQFGRTTVPFSNWELANLTRCTLTIYSVLQTQKKIEFLLMMSLAIVCHMSPTIGIIYSAGLVTAFT